MNFQSLKSKILQLGANMPGWRTNQKIVVIESDDWGSIRMPSRKTYESLLRKGMPVDKDRYNQYDTLANEKDLSALFEVLCSVKDSKGVNARITPLSLVANPDFSRIEASGFRDYYYEQLPVTLQRYGKGYEGVLALWQEGISSNIFKPQFHGREHLNISAWLENLRKKDDYTLTAFQYGLFGLPSATKSKRRCGYMSAFEFNSEEEFLMCCQIIKDGTQLFEKVLGYAAMAFMAPCGIWSRRFEPALAEAGIKVIQSGVAQIESFAGGQPDRFKKVMRFTGQKSFSGQLFTVRNCRFEPNESPSLDSVGKCLKQIDRAFKWRKPAIISSHRVNYIGALVPKNRETSLVALRDLLDGILKNWPDVVFMNSYELAQFMLKNNNA